MRVIIWKNWIWAVYLNSVSLLLFWQPSENTYQNLIFRPVKWAPLPENKPTYNDKGYCIKKMKLIMGPTNVWHDNSNMSETDKPWYSQIKRIETSTSGINGIGCKMQISCSSVFQWHYQIFGSFRIIVFP